MIKKYEYGWRLSEILHVSFFKFYHQILGKFDHYFIIVDNPARHQHLYFINAFLLLYRL